MNCEQVGDVAAELALGTISGDVRGAAIAHLEGCARCRSDVSALADVADQLLLAAPRVDPPAGFELRVLARIEAEQLAAEAAEAAVGDRSRRRSGATHPGRSRAARLAMFAASLLLVMSPRLDGSLGATASAEMRTADGTSIGNAVIEGHGPAEIVLDMARWRAGLPYGVTFDGRYQVVVERTDGTTELLDVADPEGSTWRATLDDGAAGDVASIAVIDGEHRILCSAHFDG